MASTRRIDLMRPQRLVLAHSHWRNTETLEPKMSVKLEGTVTPGSVQKNSPRLMESKLSSALFRQQIEIPPKTVSASDSSYSSYSSALDDSKRSVSDDESAYEEHAVFMEQFARNIESLHIALASDEVKQNSPLQQQLEESLKQVIYNKFARDAFFIKRPDIIQFLIDQGARIHDKDIMEFVEKSKTVNSDLGKESNDQQSAAEDDGFDAEPMTGNSPETSTPKINTFKISKSNSRISLYSIFKKRAANNNEQSHSAPVCSTSYNR